MVELFAGRAVVAGAFAARGWEATAIDLVIPTEIPPGVLFKQTDVLNIIELWKFDFIWASSPCEEFSCFGMKMFQPNPKYPEMGIRLFNHTRALCEASGAPYIMENVRPAQEFVGRAVNHCGPFYLWGNAVPPILPQGITKSKWFKRPGKPGNICTEALKGKRARKAVLATIPAELAACVADYIERLLEVAA